MPFFATLEHNPSEYYRIDQEVTKHTFPEPFNRRAMDGASGEGKSIFVGDV